MDPKTGGVHPELFGPPLKGICFINIVEAGFIFSGNVGTGIVLARNDSDGSWSPPSAIGISGLGWGFIVGASLKEIVYLIYDDQTLKAMTGKGVKLGTQVESTIANWGRTAEATNILTSKGLGANIALSYSQGLFGGIALEGAICHPRPAVNEKFYGKPVTPQEILFDRAVQVPDGDHLMPEVYEKLQKLCSGQVFFEISEAEKQKAEKVREQADKEGEDFAETQEETAYEDVSNLVT